MKLVELALAARMAGIVQGCKRLVRIGVWLGLVLGVNVTCLSEQPQPTLLAPTTTDDADEHCQKLLLDVPITQVTVDIRPRDPAGHVVPAEELPEDCNRYFNMPEVYSSLEMLMARGRGLLRCWRGAQFCHRPLYFEEACLERWGECHGCLQPTISGIKFFGTALLLPVKMWRTHPHSSVRTPLCF